jgi:hypothetical protein
MNVALSKLMTHSLKPDLGGAIRIAILISLCSLPEVLSGMIEVENPHGTVSKTRFKQSPKTSRTITDPDDLGRFVNPLSGSF